MSNEYIPVATETTVYYESKTEQDFNDISKTMEVGDFIFSQWVFNGLWYTMGLLDKNDPESKCLFPNILLDEPPKQLTRWGLARMDYLQEHNSFLAMQMGTVGLHKHCLEIEKLAIQRKRHMMDAIRKDPANRVTEKDKAQDPMAWVGRMNNFQAMVHETIYSDLIYN